MAVAEKAKGTDSIGVKKMIDVEAGLANFESKVWASELLEIDGTIYEGERYKDVVYERDVIKILNHSLKTAYVLDIGAILEQPAEGIVTALESGVTARLYGVTRIVGYYSRTSNWNKSKIGELKDRHKGDYSVA